MKSLGQRYFDLLARRKFLEHRWRVYGRSPHKRVKVQAEIEYVEGVLQEMYEQLSPNKNLETDGVHDARRKYSRTRRTD